MILVLLTIKVRYIPGLWHWSVEDIGSMKSIDYSDKIYALLNGSEFVL